MPGCTSGHVLITCLPAPLPCRLHLGGANGKHPYRACAHQATLQTPTGAPFCVQTEPNIANSHYDITFLGGNSSVGRYCFRLAERDSSFCSSSTSSCCPSDTMLESLKFTIRKLW